MFHIKYKKKVLGVLFLFALAAASLSCPLPRDKAAHRVIS